MVFDNVNFENAANRLGLLIAGFSDMTKLLNAELIFGKAKKELIHEVIGEGRYNRAVYEFAGWVDGLTIEDFRKHILIRAEIANSTIKYGNEVNIITNADGPHGLFGLFDYLHLPVLRMANQVPKDLGRGGYVLRINTTGKVIPLHNLDLTFSPDIISDTGAKTKAARIFNKQDLRNINDGRLILSKDTPIMIGRRWTRSNGAKGKRLYDILDDNGEVLQEEISSKMLWLYLGSLGFNSHGEESRERRTLMFTGFDDAFTANNALIEYITFLEKNHGYKPMQRFESFLDDTKKRVEQYIESVNRAEYLLQSFNTTNSFGYRYAVDVQPGILTIRELYNIFQLKSPHKSAFPKAFVRQTLSISDVIRHRSTHIDVEFEYQGLDYVIRWQQLRPISFLSDEAFQNKGFFSPYPYGYPNKGVWMRIAEKDKASVLEIAREELEDIVRFRVVNNFFDSEINALLTDLRLCQLSGDILQALHCERHQVERWLDKIGKIYDRVFDLGLIVSGHYGYDYYFIKKVNSERFASNIHSIVSEWNDKVRPALEATYNNLPHTKERNEISLIIELVDGGHGRDSLSKRLEILAKHLEKADYIARHLSVEYRAVILDENELKMTRNGGIIIKKRGQVIENSEPALLY